MKKSIIIVLVLLGFVARGQYYIVVDRDPISAKDIAKVSWLTEFKRPTLVVSCIKPIQSYISGWNAKITLTSDVEVYTMSHVPDGGYGDISVIQTIGGCGIKSIIHEGLIVRYADFNRDGIQDPPVAENINSKPNGHTVISFKRIDNVLYITYGWF